MKINVFRSFNALKLLQVILVFGYRIENSKITFRLNKIVCGWVVTIPLNSRQKYMIYNGNKVHWCICADEEYFYPRN